MTPIRFRAWHRAEKVLARVVGFHFDESDDDMSMATVDLYPELPSWHFKDCIIQQATGLKDKNRKEIFEGDIVKVGFGHEWNDPSKYDFRGVMRYDPEFMRFTATTNDGTMTDNYSVEWYEIIGNIYENPSLLS